MAEPPLPLPPFAALRAFHAAARHDRLRDAAAELGVTESAVSHQIRKLEEHLRTSLFDRRPDGLHLTAVGERYFAEIDPAIGAIAGATRTLMGDTRRKRVSLTLPPSLAIYWLIPRLGEFERAHPDIDLDLVTTTRVIDLRRERLDLAIRYGRGPWPGLHAEFLLGETATPVCAPDFLGHGDADPAAVLARCRLITNTYHPDEWREWAAARGLPAPDPGHALRLESQEQVLGAAAQGLGLGIGRSPMVDGLLRHGTLIAPFATADPSPASFHLCHDPARELTIPAMRVARWLREAATPAPSSTP